MARSTISDRVENYARENRKLAYAIAGFAVTGGPPEPEIATIEEPIAGWPGMSRDRRTVESRTQVSMLFVLGATAHGQFNARLFRVRERGRMLLASTAAVVVGPAAVEAMQAGFSGDIGMNSSMLRWQSGLAVRASIHGFGFRSELEPSPEDEIFTALPGWRRRDAYLGRVSEQTKLTWAGVSEAHMALTEQPELNRSAIAYLEGRMPLAAGTE